MVSITGSVSRINCTCTSCTFSIIYIPVRIVKNLCNVLLLRRQLLPQQEREICTVSHLFIPPPQKNLRRRWVNCGCDTLTLTLALALTFMSAHPRFSRRLPLPVSEIFQPTSEIIWDTFTLEVPRWLYDYFSLGVFYILTCCVWFVYDL